MLDIDWIQHAVGHGGFHTGEARTDNDVRFSWVFDCGSRRTARINDYLKSWARTHRQIDWLFISHFDTDHVSGLDMLLSRTKVRDVMIPYVNERELAYALLREIGKDRFDRAFVELVADPANFFLSRGAERVTFLGSGDIAGPDDARDSSSEGPRDGDGWRVKVNPAPLPLGELDGVAAIPEARVCVIKQQTCEIFAINNNYGLRLLPYRAPINTHHLHALVRHLQVLVGQVPVMSVRPGLGGLAYAIAEHARTPQGRKSLRSIFATHAGSSNRSSLSLLSVPTMTDQAASRWRTDTPFLQTIGRGEAAWMNTGDAELLAANDLSDWSTNYANELDAVRVMALPHHGSDRNSDAMFQSFCPQAILTAHVKAGAKKHPGINVSALAGSRLARVTEDPQTAAVMNFFAP